MAAGVPIIPIRQDSKQPVCAWQHLAYAEQWQQAGGKLFTGNIAGVLGGGIAVLDGDNAQAAQNLNKYLDGLGIRAPEVHTPHGAHFWLRIDNTPQDVSYRLLSPEIGAGELRVQNCYVLVPSSRIGSSSYRFVYGSPEMIGSMRSVRWQDLLALLPEQAHSSAQRLECLPVRLLRREMPARAAQLFELLRGAPQSEPVDGVKYQSRSEAEAAILACLILAGWDYSEIAQTFEIEQPAHFVDAKKQADRYLQLTWRSVLGELASNQERLVLADWWQQAEQRTWQGAGGALDLAVYQALCAIAWQHSSYTVNASQRDLAEHAAACRYGVASALQRLEAAGLVRRLAAGAGVIGSLWQVQNPQKTAISHSIKGHLEQNKKEQQQAGMAQLFARGGLGRSARLVLAALTPHAQSITQLAERTGKAWGTVRAALSVLERYELACVDGRLWRSAEQPAQFEQIVKELSCDAIEERRHERHKRERLAWRERLVDIGKHKRLHASKRKQIPKSRYRGREPVFEPALSLEMAEPALLRQSNDLPAAAAMRLHPVDSGVVFPAQPTWFCEHGHMAWYQPHEGARWRCAVCDDKRRKRSPAKQLTAAEEQQRKALLLAQAAQWEAEHRDQVA